MELMRQMLDDMFHRVRVFSARVAPRDGVLRLQMKWMAPHVGHTMPFVDAVQALTLLQSGKTTGKVLLEVNCQ